MRRRPISASHLKGKPLLSKGGQEAAHRSGGVRYSGAEKELLELAEKYNIPVSETQAGKGLIDWKHPLNLGGIGVTGGKAANVIGKDADLIIGVGTRFTDFTTASKWLFKVDRKGARH
jgi:3D-(3,5/4)-trihydroxycyclohexane-1,2-dione acylhydrolase (decyclizing)